MLPKYQVYPSLLNAFHNYLVGDYIDFDELINRINRVKSPTTDAQQKGIDFENVVTSYMLTGEVDTGQFNHDLIKTIAKNIPDRCVGQLYVSFRHKDILIYGYADYMGSGRVIDLKTTGNYTFPKYLHDHQTLYAYGLRDKGVYQQEYLITDFKEWYREPYSVDSYDFDSLLSEAEYFTQFLEEYRDLIIDEKIFNYRKL